MISSGLLEVNVLLGMPVSSSDLSDSATDAEKILQEINDLKQVAMDRASKTPLAEATVDQSRKTVCSEINEQLTGTKYKIKLYYRLHALYTCTCTLVCSLFELLDFTCITVFIPRANSGYII